MKQKFYKLSLGLALFAFFSFLGKANATTCPNAQVIPGNSAMPYTVATTCGATDDITASNSTICGLDFYYGGLEALYVFTPDAPISNFTVSYTGQTWTGVFIFQGCPTSGGTCVTNVSSSTASKVTSPVNLAAGVTYYIMIDTWPSPPSACPGSMTLNGTVLLPCTGATGGTLTGPAAACPAQNFTITAPGATVGAGVNYQWQSSTDGGFSWNNVAGQTAQTFNGNQTVATDYRLRVICVPSDDTAFSAPISILLNNFLSCYCNSNFTSVAFEYITNVTLGTINNTSAGNIGGPVNYTSQVADVIQGVTYPLSVTIEPDANEYVYAFIDWNQNGILNDAGEVYTIASATSLAGPFVVNIPIPANAAIGNTRMRVMLDWANATPNPCSNATFGEAEDYTLNVLPPPANEAGVLAITKPEIAACSLGQDLFVEVQNLGTDTLTSADFQVTVSGLVLPVANWTGSVPPQSSQEIQIPILYVFADGDSVSVTVSNPNGVAEDPLFAFNNFVGRRVRTALSGVKTVYGVGADYADIDAAVDALELRGVCDTVFFQIASGNYTTQHKFTPYLGAGAGKLAVFESATGNAADVTFAFAGTSTANNYVFQFDAGDFYMLRNLTATNTGATFGTVVDIRNGADDLTFEGNKFIGDTIGTNVVGDFDRIVVASVQATTDQRTVLRNNDIIGGTRAIVMAAPAGQYEFGHVIENNNIIQNTTMGALLGSVSNPVVKGNTVRNRTNVTGEAYSIIVNGAIDGGLIGSNDFATQRTGAVIYLINAKGGSNEFVVANNFINSADSVGLSRGIWIQDVNSTAIAVVNNSISFNSDNATAGAVTITDGSQIRLLNNNVGAFGNAPAARIEKAYSVSESNNNNIFGTSIANLLGVNYTTLAAFQAASGTDANSVSVNPGFNGTDLHTCAPELNGAGLPVAFITDDFDGDPRSSTPDIGADEFVGDANSLLAEDEFLKCPSDVVTIGNTSLNGVTYSWTPSGNTSEISTSNAGTFVVTATSNCGSFSDTAVVVNKPLPTASFTSSTVGLAAIFTNTSTNGTSYLWDFGDGNSSTEFSPTHVYTTAATYLVTLTVTNDCGTDTFGPTPASVLNVSIDENELASVSLFPNPTNGSFTVTMNNMGADASVITVIDVTGKVVMVKNVPAGENQVTLDATSFASGIYSVKIANGDFSKVIRLVRK